MKAIIVKLECITNMHVGNGDVNYNIIDNEVERDPVTGYPTIHASGVKGALREYFSLEAGVDATVIKTLFGSDERGNTTPGQLKILGADMVALAVRASVGTEPYYLVTTQKALDHYYENYHMFIGDPEKRNVDDNIPNCAVEGISLTKKESFFEKWLYILPDGDFRKLSLPVLARNKLENGISKNLWYEEVVPHESIFCFPVIGERENLEIFGKVIDGKVIQFGANASIGYGLCKVTVIGE